MTGAGWSESVGLSPHAVLVFENLARKGVLYLRWWDAARTNRRGESAPNWQVVSLRRPLVPAAGPDGKPLKGRELARAIEEGKQWARAQAMARYLVVSGQKADPATATPTAPARPLGIRAGLALFVDPLTGRLKAETPYRRRLATDVGRAARVWGDDYAWVDVRRADWERLWSTIIREVRAAGDDGLASAAHSVAHVATVGRWLRDREHIDTWGGLPSKWREDLAHDFAQIAGEPVPDVAQPRHTSAEKAAVLAAAPAVDPRLGLLLAIGGGLRPGQVLRARRADLVLDGPEGGDFGRLRIRGRGKKGGTVRELTPGERAAVDRALGVTDPTRGVLRLFEARYQADGTDYPLFPGGPLTERTPWKRGGSHAVDPVANPYAPGAGRPWSPGRARRRFTEAETAAGITPQPGRKFYGIRRSDVDDLVRLGVSPDALAQAGGWSDNRTPNAIYRDRELVLGREEARDARARIRGEETP